MRAVKDTVVSALCRLLSLTFSLFMRRASLPSEPKAILIIKPCCIGDLLMATPVIAQVRRAYPKAKLTVAVGPWAAEAIASNPKIDELIDLGSVGQGAQTKVGDYLKSIATLRERKYDICIVLDRSPLVTLLPYLAGIPNRLGIDSGGRGFSLTAKVPALPLRHEAQLYLDTLLPLGISPEHPRLEFFPQEDESLWAEEQVGEFPEPRIAIHPGGGVNPGSTLLGKRWPPERFGELAALHTKNGGSVLLIGGGSDSEAAEVVLSALAKASPALRQSPSTPPFDSAQDRLRTGSGQAARVVDLVGRTTLGQLGAVLSRCQLYIGGDSGPLHLAVAVGTPVVGIYGPSKPQVYGPFSADSRVVYKGEHCDRCVFNGGLLAECRNDLRCMEEVTVDEVYAAAKELLTLKQSSDSDR